MGYSIQAVGANKIQVLMDEFARHEDTVYDKNGVMKAEIELLKDQKNLNKIIAENAIKEAMQSRARERKSAAYFSLTIAGLILIVIFLIF